MHTEVLPLASVAVTVTVVDPTGNEEPEAWLYETVAEQLSVTVVEKVAVPFVAPGITVPTTCAGQVTTGASSSVTVTVNVHTAVFPAGSVAVAVTVVVPIENVEPEARLYVTVAEQLSEAVASKVTNAPHTPGSFDTVMFDGQLIVGATASFAVIATEALAVQPFASVTVTA